MGRKWVHYEFEVVDRATIPQPEWSTSFWGHPARSTFLATLMAMEDKKALVLTFPNRNAVQAAQQTLRQRVTRALRLGLLPYNFIITQRAQLVNGEIIYRLYVYPDKNEGVK